MKCSECPNEIPEARMAISPHVLTCSSACSGKRAMWKRRQNQRDMRARQRAQLDKEVAK